MRPFGHVFYVFSEKGQRQISSPPDLVERHRTQAIEKTIRRIPQDQVRNSPYNRPGIVKAVDDGFVYYTVAEKIQDASRRPALASHTMVLSLEKLMEDGGALLPPESKEEYQILGLPSELHNQGHRLDDIQRAIDECVSKSEIRTRELSPGWNTRELNWLLGNRGSIIRDPAGNFSAERAIGEMLTGIPPLVSAGLGFAIGYAPSVGNFHIAAYPGSANPTSSKGVSIFRNSSSFKAAVESGPAEEVMETDWEKGYYLALKVTGGDPLNVLNAFRNGSHREGNIQETITANLIAQALSADVHMQRTLDTLERNIGDIEKFPGGAKEPIRNALAPLTNRSNLARGQAEKLISALSPPVSVPPRPASQDEAANAERDRGSRNTQAEPSSQKFIQEDINDVRVALDKLKRIIDEDLKSRKGPEAGVEAVCSGVRRFTYLVIACGPGLLQSKELPVLVQGLWQEINRWVKRGGRGRERRNLFRDEIVCRKEPAAPSLFDDLMYITRQTSRLKDHAKKVERHNNLIYKILEQNFRFWR